jgi:RNA polymerase sigma-70 factor (ECF subfamily)
MRGTGREIVKSIPSPHFTPQAAASNGAAPGSTSPGAGQADEFRRLILPHLDGAYNLARYLTRDAAMGEDAVHDAMIRAHRAFGQFRGGSPRAWLFAIVRNCCRTLQAGAGGALSLVINEASLSEDAAAKLKDQPDPAPNPEEQVVHEDAMQRVRSAIEAIPEPFREAVVLRDLEDLSYAEIAEVTGTPIGTVMSRLARGRAVLTKALLPGADIDAQSRSAK